MMRINKIKIIYKKATKKNDDEIESVDINEILPTFSPPEEYLFHEKENQKTFKKILNGEEVTPKELISLMDEGRTKDLFNKLSDEVPYMIGFTLRSFSFFTVLALFEAIIGTEHKLHDTILDILSVGTYSQALNKKEKCIQEKMNKIYGDGFGLLCKLIESSLSRDEQLQGKQIIINIDGQIHRIKPSLQQLEYNRDDIKNITVGCLVQGAGEAFNDRFQRLDEIEKIHKKVTEESLIPIGRKQ